MVKHLLPAGLKGLVAGGLMAALMSSLASVFNSASTLFTVDIFKRLYPDTAEKKLVRIGKIATGFIVLLGMLWIPVMQKLAEASCINICKMYKHISHHLLPRYSSLEYFGKG